MNETRRTAGSNVSGSRLVQFGLLFVLGAAWYFATAYGNLNKIILPAPASVFDELIDVIRSGAFIQPMLVTLSELAGALLLAMVLGLFVGYICSRTGFAIRVFDPLFASLYAIPSILFYPLLVLFFGLGPASKIAMGVLIAIFPIIMATIAGFSNVEKIYKVAARSMGADNRQMFFSVLLPAALPVIASGLRIGTIHAKGGILAAEALGSYEGLGHQIVNLADQFQMARMYAFVIIAVVLALAITFIAFALEKRATRHSA